MDLEKAAVLHPALVIILLVVVVGLLTIRPQLPEVLEVVVTAEPIPLYQKVGQQIQVVAAEV
ncbi:hypothetical protein EBS57_10260 [bacterium]|nr:hypothetical protein [bacterium]